MKIPRTMTAVLLTGHGGLDQLVISHDVETPRPGDDEVLIKTTAAGINNTDINTRIAWYSKSVTGETNSGGESGFEQAGNSDASWSGEALQFPRIQGADCCGYIVAVGRDVDPSRIGERVLVRPMMRSLDDQGPYSCSVFGSECDGAFAQYTKAPAAETYRIDCNWSDPELASVPCAYSTAEGMLERANVGVENVLVTGASGGVGSAAVQLAKRRGATVTAVASLEKHQAIRMLGADRVIDRRADLVNTAGESSIDVVVDLVAGPGWPSYLDVLVRGGRYVTAGAIAGPIVELDVRTLYLKDLTLYGCTYQQEKIFSNLIEYIKKDEIKPVVARTYPLTEIHQAQNDFLSKMHVGKLVLIPPQ